jgi:hypothetical protein
MIRRAKLGEDRQCQATRLLETEGDSVLYCCCRVEGHEGDHMTYFQANLTDSRIEFPNPQDMWKEKPPPTLRESLRFLASIVNESPVIGVPRCQFGRGGAYQCRLPKGHPGGHLPEGESS